MPRDVKPLTLAFKGGLNTYSDESAISDNQVVEALNVDQDLDGSLRSRPPFADMAQPLPLGTTGPGKLLGWYYQGGNDYLIASDGSSTTYAWNGSSWLVVTATFSATSFIQFDEKAWLTSPVGETDPGGYWTPSGGFVAEANMPRGDTIAAFKERLFVAPGVGQVNGGKIFYSNVLGTPVFWPVAPQQQQIGSGDGQDIVYLTTYYSSLLIFRTESIWTWQYSASPGAGVISLVVPGVGLERSDTVVAYENTLYFMYDSKAYAFLNNRAEHINPHVPFEAADPTKSARISAVSTFNKRVLFTYYDTIYVFNLLTSTWTRWRTTAYDAVGQIMQSAYDDIETGYALAAKVLPVGAGRSQKLLKIVDKVTAATETFRCIVQTKNFNFQLASNFKILHGWGIDAQFQKLVMGKASPIVYTAATTWAQLATMAWQDLGTWENLAGGDQLSVVTEYAMAGVGPTRKYVKFGKRLRFRQISFRMEFETDGDITSAPVQLYGLTASVDTRQPVVKAIS